MNPPREPAFDRQDDRTSLPVELQGIDAELEDHFSSERAAAADASQSASLVDRILEATIDDLPTSTAPLPFVDPARTFRVGLGGALAAAVLLLVTAPIVWMLSSGSPADMPSTPGGVASTTSIDFGVFGGPRESEVMLAAVLDPNDDWLEDLTFQSDPGLDAGTILETRSFDIVDLEDDLVAIMRHSTS